MTRVNNQGLGPGTASGGRGFAAGAGQSTVADKQFARQRADQNTVQFGPVQSGS